MRLTEPMAILLRDLLNGARHGSAARRVTLRHALRAGFVTVNDFASAELTWRGRSALAEHNARIAARLQTRGLDAKARACIAAIKAGKPAPSAGLPTVCALGMFDGERLTDRGEAAASALQITKHGTTQHE